MSKFFGAQSIGELLAITCHGMQNTDGSGGHNQKLKICLPIPVHTLIPWQRVMYTIGMVNKMAPPTLEFASVRIAYSS